MNLKNSQFAVIAFGLVALTGCTSSATHATIQPIEAPPIITHSDLMEAVAFHQARVERDPKGAIGFAMLSEAHLALARAEDDDHAAQHAEEAARESLKIRKEGNARAARRLTEALMAQHRFAEAEEAAQLAVDLSGEEIQSVRLLGDVLLDLGKYEQFEKLIGMHQELSSLPEGLATLARWNEVNGDPHMALGLLNQAVNLVEKAGPGHESAEASYRTLLGWTALRLDEHIVATKQFQEALRLNPRDRKALAGLARQSFENKDWEACIRFADRATEIAPLTDVLGWKALALRELDRTDEVDQVALVIKKLNSVDDGHYHGAGHSDAGHHGSRHSHNRLYSAFLADIGRDLEHARNMAKDDLQWRKDIHAYDTLAWATYRYWLLDPKAKRSGAPLLAEAREAIRKATSTGTADPTILAHAHEILADH